jgi:hypothetical protein
MYVLLTNLTVPRGIAIELVAVPWRPIFEKCSYLREKEGVLTKLFPYHRAGGHTRRLTP